jgi:release factor glutamine methyltransferase
MPPETLRSLLIWGRRELERAGIDNAALDARILLLRTAGMTHEMLIAEPERLAPQPVQERFAAFIKRRQSQEPVSRILGEREFYGRLFKVTPATLDPRPDTETLIDQALRLKPKSILDLGTGTGAIAVTLLCELSDATGVATDISALALTVAEENALRHGVAGRLRLVQSDWYANVAGRFDLIVSNPPYIVSADIAKLADEVKKHDPLPALDGGVDGLAAYRHIASGAHEGLNENGRVLVEIGSGQKDNILAIFEESGFALASESRDLAGHVRCLTLVQIDAGRSIDRAK